MRLSLYLAPALAACAVAVPLTKRQEIEAETGDSVSGGPAAISSPNVNNGNQVDSSLVTGGGEAGDFINNAFGNSITHVNSNTANKGNIVINPSTVTSGGNEGLTANGDQNSLGDSQNIFPFVKRDAIVTGGAWESHGVNYVPVYPSWGLAPAWNYVPYPQPIAQVNTNQQNAAIVQNQS
ncbi:hypothetical protein GGF46_004183 [Coemansia sp. RSA 552]|nr:hypothetical protein GGF46_004183 [Coemansia sp. RSA 552]